MKSTLVPVYINKFDDSFDFSSEVQSVINSGTESVENIIESDSNIIESSSSDAVIENTCDELQRLCNNCCQIESTVPKYQSTPRYNPGIDYFESMITPVTNLHSRYSKTRGLVEFRMRRKNKTVTLQWVSFQGIIACSKIDHLTVTQTIANLPSSPKIWSICINYGNQIQQGWIEIDPHELNGNIRFYLNSNKSSEHIHINDWFCIPGSTVTWIVD
jgi:hypothetical protein